MQYSLNHDNTKNIYKDCYKIIREGLKKWTNVMQEIKYITNRLRSREDEEEIISDWKFAAMVIDRKKVHSIVVIKTLI